MTKQNKFMQNYWNGFFIVGKLSLKPFDMVHLLRISVCECHGIALCSGYCFNKLALNVLLVNTLCRYLTERISSKKYSCGVYV